MGVRNYKAKLPVHVFREQEFIVCRKTESGGYILKGNGVSTCRIFAAPDRKLTPIETQELTKIIDSCIVATTNKEMEEREKSVAVLDLACIFLGPEENYIFSIRDARRRVIK